MSGESVGMDETAGGTLEDGGASALRAERVEALAASLRAAARRASEALAGGLCCVFAAVPGGESKEGLPRLRAAAGFASPSAARGAAASLAGLVQEVVKSGTPRRGPAPEALASHAMGGVTALPIAFEGRVYGALVVGSAAAPDDRMLDLLNGVAAGAALRLDHAFVTDEVERLRGRLDAKERFAAQKSDEILKLSEELFAQDIELLRNHEKLGKIEKLKNDFIEKMSRELRTPLNSIIESVISVLANENDALSDAAKGSLRSALDDGTAFLRTLQNILDLWRIKQGELPVEIQEVNFRDVVDEAIFSVQDTLGDKPVAIEKHFVEPLPKIRTDLAKINQILFLLLDNAAKFTPSGRIDIRARVEGGELHCEVEDTGIGICPDDQQQIFDEFYQVDELNSTRYRGAGLGLTLVRDLLVLLEGGLSVSSDVGRGSVFRFHLPVQTIG